MQELPYQAILQSALIVIACERDYKNKDGEKETDFIDDVAWRQTAEFVGKFFKKGRMAAVSGRLQNRSWTDKEGEKHYHTEIVADGVYFGDSKPQSSENGKNGGAAPGDIPEDFTPDFDGEDGDLPF